MCLRAARLLDPATRSSRELEVLVEGKLAVGIPINATGRFPGVKRRSGGATTSRLRTHGSPLAAESLSCRLWMGMRTRGLGNFERKVHRAD